MRAPGTLGTQGTDRHGVDALRTDLYIESLLDAAGVRTAPAPGGPDVDPAVANAARVLHATLGRPHPSFRFEERLSRRLADLALTMRRAAAVGGGAGAAIPDAGGGWTVALAAASEGRPGGELVVFPGAAAVSVDGPAPVAVGRADPWPGLAGGAVASAAIASAALSIGAAAVVAWRRTHVRRGIG